MANMMDDAERECRRAEVYTARDEYERLRAAYERDVAPRGSWAAGDLLDESRQENVNSEMDFRRGYRHGACEAVDHFYAMLIDRHIPVGDAYNALWTWHERDLARWFQAAQDGDTRLTPPPNPHKEV